MKHYRAMDPINVKDMSSIKLQKMEIEVLPTFSTSLGQFDPTVTGMSQSM